MKSEFAALLDLAVSRGHTHSGLISDVSDAVLDKFRQDDPKSPSDAAVFVNEKTGDVKIFSGDDDITPKGTASQYASLARRILIAKLDEAGQTPPAAPKSPAGADKSASVITSVIGSLIFFGYNLYFLFFSFSVFIAFIFNDFFPGPMAFFSEFGVFRLFFYLILLLTPAIALFLGFRRRLYHRPSVLLKVFFLFEMPTVIACLFPLYVLGETTPFVILISFMTLSLPGIFFFHNRDLDMSPLWQKVVYFIHQYAFVFLAYLILLFSFYVPPLLGVVAGNLFGDIGYLVPGSSVVSPEYLVSHFLQMGLGLLVLLMVMAALLMPYLVLAVVWRSLVRARARLASLLSPDRLFTFEAVSLVVIFIVSALAAYQPSGDRLLRPLRDVSALTDFTGRENIARSLAPDREKIDKLIADKSSARHRYIFTRDDGSLISGYENELNFPPLVADLIQRVFINLAYPFVYQGESRDLSLLRTNYQYLFGHPPGYSVEPAVPAVPARNVLLVSRLVSADPSPSGLVASVTIEEEYSNQTNSQQEVVYEFTLPRGAVVTDLRLGPDLEFPGQIAPRGAAAQTYQQQIQVRRDPALMEQVGPRQYRLRVFPVPAKNDLATLKGRPQRVSYSYSVAAVADGYPLPQIDRQTNVYSSAATRVSLVTSSGPESLKESAAFIPFPRELAGLSLCSPMPEITGITLHASSPQMQSLACNKEISAIASLTGLKVAVFYPVSAAAGSSADFDRFLQVLSAEPGFVAGNQVDLYKFNDLLSLPVRLTAGNLDKDMLVSHFGPSKGIAPLSGFKDRYDLVFIFGSAKDSFSASDTLPFSPPTRVYYVSTDPPVFTSRITGQILQTGGDVVDSFGEGMRLYLLSASDTFVLNRYLSLPGISVASGQIPPSVSTGSPLSDLTNLALFDTALARFTTDVSGDITVLDRLNSFAVSAGIVTPYSSLISLVNASQQQTLDSLGQSYSRYQEQQAQQRLTFINIPDAETFPTFDSMQSFRSPVSNTLFGGITGLSLDEVPMQVSGGGGNFEALKSPAVGIAASSPLSLGLPGLFVIGNIALLVIGMGVYLVRMLRPKSK